MDGHRSSGDLHLRGADPRHSALRPVEAVPPLRLPATSRPGHNDGAADRSRIRWLADSLTQAAVARLPSVASACRPNIRAVEVLHELRPSTDHGPARTAPEHRAGRACWRFTPERRAAAQTHPELPRASGLQQPHTPCPTRGEFIPGTCQTPTSPSGMRHWCG